MFVIALAVRHGSHGRMMRANKSKHSALAFLEIGLQPLDLFFPGGLPAGFSRGYGAYIAIEHLKVCTAPIE